MMPELLNFHQDWRKIIKVL